MFEIIREIIRSRERERERERKRDKPCNPKLGIFDSTDEVSQIGKFPYRERER